MCIIQYTHMLKLLCSLNLCSSVLQHNQPWSGAGAPRLSRQDQLDAIPKNSALETQVHSHWMA